MPSAFERALGLAHKAEKRLAYVDVVYTRGGLRCPLRAVLGETRVESTDFEGIKVNLHVRDYILTVAELKFAGQQFVPQAGDQILEAVGDETFVQELKPLQGNGNAWQWHGPIHDAVRVHTKQVATEDA
jgi:hypothetical protein